MSLLYSFASSDTWKLSFLYQNQGSSAWQNPGVIFTSISYLGQQVLQSMLCAMYWIYQIWILYSINGKTKAVALLHDLFYFILYLLCSISNFPSNPHMTMLHPDFSSELLSHIHSDFAPWAAKLITGIQTHSLHCWIPAYGSSGFSKRSFLAGDMQATLPAELLSYLLSLFEHMQKYQEDKTFCLGFEAVLEKGLSHLNLQCGTS